MKRYTVVSRDANSWTRTVDGDFHEIIWMCGHAHKSVLAAEACRKESALFLQCAYHAKIETVAADQKYAGREVSEDEIYGKGN